MSCKLWATMSDNGCGNIELWRLSPKPRMGRICGSWDAPEGNMVFSVEQMSKPYEYLRRQLRLKPGDCVRVTLSREGVSENDPLTQALLDAATELVDRHSWYISDREEKDSAPEKYEDAKTFIDVLWKHVEPLIEKSGEKEE